MATHSVSLPRAPLVIPIHFCSSVCVAFFLCAVFSHAGAILHTLMQVFKRQYRHEFENVGIISFLWRSVGNYSLDVYLENRRLRVGTIGGFDLYVDR